MLERTVKRYSAYFRGWCQAFGEHDSYVDNQREIYWLLKENQAGFVLPPGRLKQLYRAVLLPRQSPPLTFLPDRVEVGEFHFGLTPQHEEVIHGSIRGLLEADIPLHVYLTSHFMYGTDARIMTLSTKKPINIIYKEIGDITLRLG